jgi:predicted ABC-type transport system involved in lysophospholipase L1 biosynthesis ATPase subunit
MSLQPPIEFEGDTLLVFRVPVPARAAELIAPCLRAAMRGLMVEMFGAQSLRTAGARAQTPAPPVELSDEPPVELSDEDGRHVSTPRRSRLVHMQRSYCGGGASRRP